MDLDLTAVWTCLSFKSGDGSDEMIVEIRKAPTWWGKVWRGEIETVTKVVFVGFDYEWLRPPSFSPITDIITKYRLRDMWSDERRVETTRGGARYDH